MTKIVINTCYGGFGLSLQAITEYLKLKGKEAIFYKEDRLTKKYHKTSEIPGSNGYWLDITTTDQGKTTTDLKDIFSKYDIPRDDPDLVKVVETLGDYANGRATDLKIVEIPDDVDWIIEEYDDGQEWVAERHRTWR